MKKSIIYILSGLLVLSCAAKKPERRSTFLKGFSSYYNTIFNAKDALNTELEERDKGHKDNFYAPYISILTYEDDASVSEIPSQKALFTKTDEQERGALGGSDNAQKGATILEIAEAKALKAITKYSIPRKDGEHNKMMFDAYIILAQSRIYQNKPRKALEALNHIFTDMKTDKRVSLARIYEGLAYSKMQDYTKANKLFAELKSSDIKKEYQKLVSIYYAESLLKGGDKTKATEELNNAFTLNNNRKIKSRIAYLKGQVLMEQGEKDLARASFMDAYKYANDFEFEVKSQIEIAKTYGGKSDYEGAKKYLETISKKGTYASRKNEFSYALGLIANKAEKKEEAQTFFKNSLTEKISDPQIRGFSFYEIGKYHFDKNDYIHAGAYYDSAIAVMTYEPSKKDLVRQSAYIKKISKNYYLVKKNDSILALAKMTPEQKNTYFTAYIDKLKAKEEKEELLRKREERAKGFDTGDYSANSIFANNKGGFEDFGSTKGGFYFSNTNTVSKGSSNFKQIWGSRGLADNWRYSAKTATLEDLKSAALGVSSAPNPRRYEPSFYIESIPTDAVKLASLKKDRDTASLGLGIMYENFFGNTPFATKTLYDLVDNQPEEKIMLQALYEIFAMNYEKNPSSAERAKQILLNEYPYTSYAEFARNPRSTSFVKTSEAAETDYKNAFALYENEKFEASKSLIDQSIQKYPTDALIPKFYLLNAFNAGKTSGKEVMILQLEQIALNYANTPEGEKAKEMLGFLKSDLKVEMTTNKENALNQKQNNIPSQPNLDNSAETTAAKKERERIKMEGREKRTKGGSVEERRKNRTPEKPPGTIENTGFMTPDK